MAATEIWLRLMEVRGLYGDTMLQVAQKLLNTAVITHEVLTDAGLNDAQRHAFWQTDPVTLKQTMRWLEQPQNHLLTADNPLYPAQLKNMARYPAVLFVTGDLKVLNLPQLAVVGSRDCSHYGREWGNYFARSLALSGLVITSGLARGIDGVAHRAALAVNGKTIAVSGSGFACLYPKQHRKLADEIVSAGGALVTEFSLFTPPRASNFPRRNRIISGLSLGVLVVEASLKSGSLVTARYALEQNRDVYALPGPLGSNGSEGVHWLIQQGALLVAHPDNILEQIHSDLSWLTPATDDAIHESVSNEMPPFVDVLDSIGDEATSVDVIAERTGQAVSVIVTQLLELELAGWVVTAPGGYIRLRRAGYVSHKFTCNG